MASAPHGVLLSTSDGVKAPLSHLTAKPVVIFYEDKDSLTVNQPLKEQLTDFLRARPFLKASQVLAVANLRVFNWFPARQFALAGVRRAERENGLTVYIDFDNAMSKPPLQLGTEGSSVVVLDAQGTVLFKQHGALSEAERARVLLLLEEASQVPVMSRR